MALLPLQVQFTEEQVLLAFVQWQSQLSTGKSGKCRVPKEVQAPFSAPFAYIHCERKYFCLTFFF